MSKTIVEKKLVDKEGGVSVGVGLYVEEDNLQLQIAVDYPLAKIIEPAAKGVDSLLDKLEKLIPGSWDKPLIEKVKKEFREELVELLGK